MSAKLRFFLIYFNLFQFFSKQYINYTTVLTEDNENLLTFGILGRIFHLDELQEEEDGGAALLYLLLTLLAGLLTIFIILKLFRS